jgi:hypothetical protein
MDWIRRTMLPAVQGSEFAKEIDFVYMGLFWLSVVLFLGITVSLRAGPGYAASDAQHNA